MRIYQLSPKDEAQRLLLANRHEQREFVLLARKMIGHPSSLAEWEPLQLVPAQHGEKYRFSDYSAIERSNQLPVFSNRARKDLSSELDPLGQWLSVELDAPVQYWIFNLTHRADVLDSNETILENGRIRVFAFQKSRLDSEWMFRVPLQPQPVLVTDRFRNRCLDLTLTGIHFEIVWDSDYPPFPARPNSSDILERPEIFGPEGIRPSGRWQGSRKI